MTKEIQKPWRNRQKPLRHRRQRRRRQRQNRAPSSLRLSERAIPTKGKIIKNRQITTFMKHFSIVCDYRGIFWSQEEFFVFWLWSNCFIKNFTYFSDVFSLSIDIAWMWRRLRFLISFFFFLLLNISSFLTFSFFSVFSDVERLRCRRW